MKNFFRSIFGFATNFILSASLAFWGMLGFFATACSHDGLEWTVLLLIAMPLVIPVIGFAWLVAVIIVTAFYNPVESVERFERSLFWVIGMSALSATLAWLFAVATSAQESCTLKLF